MSTLPKLWSVFSVEILVSRQKKAEALKKMTDVAVRMSEEQLVELRADIKVSFSLRFCLIQPGPNPTQMWCRRNYAAAT